MIFCYKVCFFEVKRKICMRKKNPNKENDLNERTNFDVNNSFVKKIMENICKKTTQLKY